jgi:hypothetical protein
MAKPEENQGPKVPDIFLSDWSITVFYLVNIVLPLEDWA